ncbi:MAG: hypothetical protein R3A43_04925 [Bacteroidia bacterium]
MKHRNSYHSTIKLAFALDIHKQWLPDSFIKSIPRSTSWAWKFDTTEKFVGHQYAIDINDNVEELKLLYDDKLKREKQLLIAYARIKIIILEFFGKNQYKTFLKENFREILRFIYASKNTFDGGVRSMCRFLEIHPSTFAYWRKALEVHGRLEFPSVTHISVRNQKLQWVLY